MPYIPTSFVTVWKPCFIVTQKYIADLAIHRRVVALTTYITFTAFRLLCVFYQRFVVVIVTVIYGPVWIEADPATQDTSEYGTFHNIFLVRM
jgi:hypothetical protein